VRTVGGRDTIELDLALRDVRFSQPVVLAVPEKTPTTFFDEGTVSILVLDPETADGASALKLADSKDVRRLDRVASQAARDYAAIGRAGTRLFGGLHEVPVLGEIRYGRKTLRSGMFVGGGLHLATAKVLYNGGELDPKSFGFVQYVNPAVKGALQAIVVVHGPRLSDLEKEMLSRVPTDQSEVNLGEGPGYWTDAAVQVGDWANDAYDRADAERAANLNTPEVIERVARNAQREIETARDLTRDFWDNDKDLTDRDMPFVEIQQQEAVDQQQDAGVEQQQAAGQQEAGQGEAENEAVAADAEGGIGLRAADLQGLVAAKLSPTASARSLLALRGQLLVQRQLAQAQRQVGR
jgi:hypothetical protein